jgi:arylsulfatase A-like enzyme
MRPALLVLAALLAVLVSVSAGCGGDKSAEAAPGAPNFVVVMTDDQAIRSLDLMPHVEGDLVDRGETFERSFVTTPDCCPSRASWLTGQYAHNHGVLSADPPEGGYAKLKSKGNILPAWLEDAGYRTGHVGKYLNGYGIEERGSSPTEVPSGWDYWRAPVNHTEYQMYDYTLNEDGKLKRYGDKPSDYQTDVLARQSADFLREQPRDQPFYLSIAPVAPHSEGVLDDKPNAHRNPRPAPRDLGAYRSLPTPMPPSFGKGEAHAPPTIRRKRGRKADNLAGPSIRASFLGRAESLLAVDDMVGRLVRTLKQQGELENTYFIFTSDNGFLLGEHGLKGKVLAYEESVRVPLVIRGPGIKPGSRTNALVANIDMAPTIAQLASAQLGRTPDGASLVPLLRGGKPPERDLLLEFLVGREAFRAVRTDRWKFAKYLTGGSELFDEQKDPYELHNLAANPAYRGIRSRLADELRSLKDCAGRECR